MPEIEIIVAKDGSITVEAKGVVGPGCTDLTKTMENALGDVESRECKIEYHEAVPEAEEVRQGGGA